MNWKQKALSGLMAGGFGLRWLAGHHVGADDPAFAAALHAVDVALGWMLAAGVVLALRWLWRAARRASARRGHPDGQDGQASGKSVSRIGRKRGIR